MKTQFVIPALLVTVLLVWLFGRQPDALPNPNPTTSVPTTVPVYSIAIAVDVSYSGQTFKVPSVDLRHELQPIIEYLIQHGGGNQLAVTQISKWSDTSPALLVISETPPQPPVIPEIEHYPNLLQYRLARNLYEQETLPQYLKDSLVYATSCNLALEKFWAEVNRVFTGLDSNYSNYHAACNRLGIVHNNSPAAHATHISIIIGDGVNDTPRPVPLVSDYSIPIHTYWVAGTANPDLIMQQEWVKVFQPQQVTTLATAINIIFSHHKTQRHASN